MFQLFIIIIIFFSNFYEINCSYAKKVLHSFLKDDFCLFLRFFICDEVYNRNVKLQFSVGFGKIESLFTLR